ncbi:MAG: hypothetical protein ACOY0T_38060 [Myxococcota bacterium]
MRATQSTKDDYPGPSASKTYDKYFGPSHSVPRLKSHVPQGLATWPSWNGKDDLLLVSSYSPQGKHACVIGLNAKTGKHVGTAKVKASHVGAVAIFERLGWAYLSSDHKYRVRKYALDALRDAIARSRYVRQEGADIKVFGASFLASHAPTRTLWAGRFDSDERDYMHCYEVAADGSLEPRDGVWQVPRATQGLAVTDGMFIYSCSWGRNDRSSIYLVRRGAGSTDLDKARLARFFAPSMSEGVTVCGSDIYIVYESGAREYNIGPDRPRNRITRLHKASLASLEKLCPPAVSVRADTREAPRRRAEIPRAQAVNSIW